MQAKVLVVDDEPNIVRLVQSYLVRDGYNVITAPDGAEAVRQFRQERPDLVVLDLRLPRIDGMDVARTIRREAETPIIMLTARTEESDKLTGLEIGADDYVTKPFSPRELVARVKVVLRRTLAGESRRDMPEISRVSDLIIDRVQREVARNGQKIALTSYQFDLLLALVRRPGQVLTRDQLIDLMTDDGDIPFDRTIDAHMKNLRRALGDDAANPRYIETVRGVGYRMIPHINGGSAP